MNTYYDCSGCGVCALVCPTWTQNSDIFLTPWGRAKAVQGGASAEDLKASLESCVECGACTPMCPEKIDIYKEDRKILDLPEMPLDNDWYEEKLLLSETFKEHETFSRIIKRLVYLKSKGNELVSDSVHWHRKLIETKSPHNLMSIGEWLIEKKLIYKQMRAGDLYWMDAPLFHIRYEKLVKKYDRFKKETKCELNWNLQRTAMPVGKENSYFSREKQYDWVLMNKNVKRIVVENIDDWKWLKNNSPLPVYHVCELVGES